MVNTNKLFYNHRKKVYEKNKQICLGPKNF